MTVKQLIIGTLLGASAIGLMLHRLPKQAVKGIKLVEKQAAKQQSRAHRPPRKQTTETRLSLNKIFFS